MPYRQINYKNSMIFYEFKNAKIKLIIISNGLGIYKSFIKT
jgi:hypothetical protein